ncbi:HAD family hydrolase [Chitinivorax sp. B]|uniref:HAD family hydrolase n=1 Tax=Chitinivorax sp. B TaxID=2502235 RepID=UPI0010F43357|nr:HAD family hydrolase [Chitinivorax sp. B]
MSTTVVLFDLDDTLFDHQYAAHMALKTVHAEFVAKTHIPFEVFENVHWELMDTLHRHIVSGEMSLDQVRVLRFQQLLARFDLDLPHSPLQLANRQRSVFLDNRQLIPGAQALLIALRQQGIQIGIITNNTLNEQVDKLAHLGIADFIDQLITVDVVGVGKPEPDIFHFALARHRCDPDQAVMVGDSWENDIQGAANAGIRSVWLNRRHLPRASNTPCSEIHHLTPTDKTVAVILGHNQNN